MNLANTNVTMSSRDIAELTGKNHADVLRDIRNMLESLGLGESSFADSYFNSQNKEQPMFRLPYDETICLLTGYDVKSRMAVIKRWQELETKAVPPAPVNIPLLEKLNIIEKAKITLGNDETKHLFPLIWQTISDGVQNDIVAMFDSSKPLLKSTVAVPLDVIEIAKRNNITIPSNLKSILGKYVKKHSTVPAVVTERVINGSIMQSNAYTNYDEVLKLIKEKLNIL